MEKVKYLTRHQKKILNLSDDCLFSKDRMSDNNSDIDDSDVDSHGNIKGLIDYSMENSPTHKKSYNIKKIVFSSLLNSLKKHKKMKLSEINNDSGGKTLVYALKRTEISDSDSDYKSEEEDDIWYCSEEEKYLKGVGKTESKELRKVEEKVRLLGQEKIPFRFRLLKSSGLSDKNKLAILKKIDHFYSLDSTDNEYHKLNVWIEGIKQIPFGIYKNADVTYKDGSEKILKYLKNVHSVMEKSVYGHQEAKTKILQIISKWIVNPKSYGNVIALCGPMGNGKTTLVKKGISKAVNKPFTFIGLGGACDSSFLEGHEYTYEGSRNGRIVDILKTSGCMNPIIFFDELDKLSETKKGQEISNLLCHITDPSQNDKFNDRYYSGIDFDISKSLFIFSMNDETKINPILKDRITIIKMKGFKEKDKIQISKKYLLPDILKEYNFNSQEISFDDNVIKYIINNYTQEKGVRKLKESFDTIISKLNVLKITSDTELIKLKTKLTFPIKITKQLVDELITKKDDNMSLSVKMMYV